MRPQEQQAGARPELDDIECLCAAPACELEEARQQRPRTLHLIRLDLDLRDVFAQEVGLAVEHVRNVVPIRPPFEDEQVERGEQSQRGVPTRRRLDQLGDARIVP